VIGEPPSVVGGAHVSVMTALPVDAVNDCGTSGTVAVAAAVVAKAATTPSASALAITVNTTRRRAPPDLSARRVRLRISVARSAMSIPPSHNDSRPAVSARHVKAPRFARTSPSPVEPVTLRALNSSAVRKWGLSKTDKRFDSQQRAWKEQAEYAGCGIWAA
jgi:hypothetical protein